MRTTITKGYLTVLAVITVILLVLNVDELTLATCEQILLFSAIATAIVMAIWFIVGMWVCGPVTRFLSKTFEIIGR